MIYLIPVGMIMETGLAGCVYKVFCR